MLLFYILKKFLRFDGSEVNNYFVWCSSVLKNPNVTFVGNFEAGKDISLAKLKESYHAILLVSRSVRGVITNKQIIWGNLSFFVKLIKLFFFFQQAYGASEDRKLNIPGEKENVVSAREFVGWYNGLPENRNLSISFEDKKRAIIIGQVGVQTFFVALW